ncbi:MAG: S8 family serine peptidase [Bacteroidetes bacterium]|nr:S8 family serine peptidase [Bacteroidota bacterium]
MVLFVAGCAAAQTDNGIGKSGVGFNCKLRLSAWYNNFDWITPSMQFALYGARVFNYSFKVGCSPTAVHQSFCDLMFDYGCVLVSAAGNGTSGTYCNGGPQPGNNGYVYPASYNHVISVSGVDQYYQHYPTIGGNSYTHNDKVDICAPAYSVLSLGPSNTYIPSSGTSFSSPYVAGVAALILSVNPCLNGDQVLDIIQQTAFDIYPYQTNSPVSLAGLLGAGLVDAGAAVAYAQTASYPQFIMGSPDFVQAAFKLMLFMHLLIQFIRGTLQVARSFLSTLILLTIMDMQQ